MDLVPYFPPLTLYTFVIKIKSQSWYTKLIADVKSFSCIRPTGKLGPEPSRNSLHICSKTGYDGEQSMMINILGILITILSKYRRLQIS